MFLSKKSISINFDKVPECAGVYIFLNSKKEVLYVGSSSNIKERFKQYITMYNSMRCRICNGFYNEVYALALIVKRLDEVSKVKYIKSKPSKNNPFFNIIPRKKEQEVMIKLHPKYCGETVNGRSREDYINYNMEVEKVNKEIGEYICCYKDALIAFDEVMKIRFKEVV